MVITLAPAPRRDRQGRQRPQSAALRVTAILVMVASLLLPTATWAVPESERGDGMALQTQGPALIQGEVRTAVPGQELSAFASRTGLPDRGHFEFTAPSHTTFNRMQHQLHGVLASTLSADGRTARSVRSDINLELGVFMRVTIDDDAPLGTFLDDGSMRLVSPAGQVLAEGTFGFRIPAAPEVLAHPEDVSVLEGEDAEFSVELGGDSLSVRWRVSTDGGVSFADVPGETSTTLRLESVVPTMDGWLYRSVATNAVSPTGVTTDAARLTVRAALPVISEHPADVTVDVGSDAELTAAATGHDISTQWQVSPDDGASWVDVDGATDPTLTIDDITREMDGWQYRAVFTNSAGSATSRAATLTVTVPARFVTQFLSHPSDQHVNEGDSFSLTWRYHASGTGRRVLQGSDDEGETWKALSSGTFSGPAAPGTHFSVGWGPLATAEYDGRLVRAVLRVEGEEEVISETTRLTVGPVTPVVEVHPASTTVIEGNRVELVTAHTGTTFPTTVQWQRSTDGGETWADVEGEAGSTLTLATTTLEMDGWQLRAVHTNAAGSAVTDAATLTVHPVPPQATVSIIPTVRLVDQLP